MQKLIFTEFNNNDVKQGSTLVLKASQKETKAGKPFVVMTLSDGTSKIDARTWDTSLDDVKDTVEQVIDVELERRDYNGSASYVVNNVLGFDNNADMSEYVKCVRDAQQMYDSIIKILSEICTIPERQIALNLYREYKDQLINWAAATSNHHALNGGLIYHTNRMISTAVYLRRVYFPDRKTNQESMKSWNLLVIGCALHDIGKLKELETNNLGNATYTKEGNFFGHLFIGATMILDEAKKGEYDEATVERLVHMIISHHGKLEYGAIKQPATKEAIMLNMIDDMDARVEACEEAMEETEPGSFSSPVFMLERTKIYKEND